MNRQRLDHLIQIWSPRFLCLSKDFDLLLKCTYLLILLLAVSTVVRFININDFDCNNHSSFRVTAAGEPKVSQENGTAKKVLPLVYPAKGTFTDKLVESIFWYRSTTPPTLLDDTRLLCLRQTDSLSAMLAYCERRFGAETIHRVRI